GAGLRVGHEAAGAQHATQTTDLAHQVRCSHGRVEVGPAAGDPLDQLVVADLVGAGLPGGVGLRTGREDDDAGGLAGAVGQVDGATHHLIGLAGIHAQTHGDLDGGVELRRCGLLGQTHGVQRCVEAAVLDLGGAVPVCLATDCHCRQPSTVMPMERAVPATTFAAASTSFAFRSGILVSAISRTCAWVILPTLSVCGVDEPFWRPAAFLISSAAGGVLVMKVNERSSYTVISTGMMFPRWSAVASL